MNKHAQTINKEDLETEMRNHPGVDVNAARAAVEGGGVCAVASVCLVAQFEALVVLLAQLEAPVLLHVTLHVRPAQLNALATRPPSAHGQARFLTTAQLKGHHINSGASSRYSEARQR